MFFSKKNELKSLSGKKFVMIGTSPALMFLASELLDQGAEVVFLLEKKKREIYQKNGAFSIKKIAHQTKYYNFKFEEVLLEKPDCCIIGSDVGDFKGDVLLLANKNLKDVPVINLAGFGNDKIVKELAKPKVFRGVFSVWVNREKNAVTVYGKNHKIDLETPEDEDVELIKKLFTGVDIGVNFLHDMTKSFEQKKMAYVLGNMLMVIYDKSVVDLIKDVDVCEIIRKTAKEWEKVLKKKELNLSTKTVLPEMSNFEQGYKSEFSSKKGVDSLLKMMDFVDKFETPQLFELVMALCKKF